MTEIPRTQQYLPHMSDSSSKITDLSFGEVDVYFDQDTLEGKIPGKAEYIEQLQKGLSLWAEQSETYVQEVEEWIDKANTELESINEEKKSLGKLRYKWKYGAPDNIDRKERSRIRDCKNYISDLVTYNDFAKQGKEFVEDNRSLIEPFYSTLMDSIDTIINNCSTAINYATSATKLEEEIASE